MSVPKFATLSLLVFMALAAVIGPTSPATAAAVGAQTDSPSTTSTTVPEARRSASGTTHTVTVGLLAIAGITAVMGSAYFWYTIPSRRQRIAERRR